MQKGLSREIGQRSYHFIFGGGLDLVTPNLEKPEGCILFGNNYEPRPEGYRRIDGYERFDGHVQPHKASFSMIRFDTGTIQVFQGQIITGGTSSATGTVLVEVLDSTGLFAVGDATGYLILTDVSGDFVEGENLMTGGSPVSFSTGLALEFSAPTDILKTTYSRLAIEWARAQIQTVPGQGLIRGVWRYDDAVYAFRDNAAGTACDMWRSGDGGWTQCDLGYGLAFKSGKVAIEEGQTITGSVSGAVAVVKRVIVDSGTWAGSDAAGRIVMSSPTGMFFQTEIVMVGTVSVAVAGGDSTENVLKPGGRFEFDNYNFTGFSGNLKMYGVDGVSNGFEWDGSVFVPILTGTVEDVPVHVHAHKNHLFYSFRGGSVQHSGIGTPYQWTLLLGAAEIGAGNEITSFMVRAGTLVIYSNKQTLVLYGDGAASWDLQTLNSEAGAFSWSVQDIGVAQVHVDVNGVRDLTSTDAYGDFSIGRLSILVDPWFDRQRRAGRKILASLKIKAKNQYRIFYDNGSSIILDLSKGIEFPEFAPFNYEKIVHCASATEDRSGEEWVLFGSDDGYVYRAESGYSFDGRDVAAFIRFSFNNLGWPSTKKRFFKGTLELESVPETVISMSAEFSYGRSVSQPGTEFDTGGGGGNWSEDYWSEMYWSAAAEGRAVAELVGTGNNISLLIQSKSAYVEPHTLHGVIYNYTNRKMIR